MAHAEPFRLGLDDEPISPPSSSMWERRHVNARLEGLRREDGRVSPITYPETSHHAELPQTVSAVRCDPHCLTPPIAVPYHDDRSHPHTEAVVEHSYSPQYADISPLEQYMRNRQRDISFNPEVRLDTGDSHAVDVPLKFSCRKRSIGRTSLLCSTSGLQTLSSPGGPHDELYRESMSDEKHHYNGISRQCKNLRHIVSSPISEGVSKLPRPTSLTSLSTASPVTEEIVTPPDELRGPFSSSCSTSPTVLRSGSLGDAESWLNPGHHGPLFKGRTGSLRQSRVPRSRRSNTSSGKSPASAFLSMWNSHEVPPEPDEEGQLVGTDYVLGKQIGFGGFSVVKEAFKVKENGETERFAVKIVRKHLPGKTERENDQVQAEFDHEVRIWRYLNHPHVLPLDAVYVTDAATFCFTPLTTGGTLFDLVRRNRGGLKINQARLYAYQLAQAIRYLHEDARVVHRDIKLENCLLEPKPSNAKNEDDVSHLILCDFGMAEWMNREANSDFPDPYDNSADRLPPRNIGPSDTSTSRAGSLEYASPELLSSNEGVLDPIVDIWAFGVVTFALLVGSRPFQHSFQPRVQMSILGGHWDRNAVLRGDGDRRERQDALEVIQGCLEMDPVKRWTISEVISARWFESCVDIVKNEHNLQWGL
ncbi:hypothetical protein VTO42DRAFT_4094 [Malbranchea cinnamomea]